MEIASVGTGGVLGDGGSFYVTTSADSRYVTFESLVGNWANEPADKENWVDIYVRDRQSDKTVKATYNYKGGLTNESSYDPSITADGRYVAYFSYASNLVPNDTNGSEWSRDGLDVFLYDTQTRKNERVSLRYNGSQISGNSVGSISPDGKYILLQSDGQVLSSAPGGDSGTGLYLRDWRSGDIELVSRARDGGLPNAISLYMSISYDNRFVVYGSEATNLVRGDNNGEMDVFLYDRMEGTTRLISRGLSGRTANGRSSQPRISYDGKTIIFLSYASDLVAGDTNGYVDIFVYDVVEETISRVSTAEDGTQANGSSREPSVCHDGRFVSYTTDATNLVPGDKNGERDVILHDRVEGTNTVASMNRNGKYGNGRAHRSFLAPDCQAIAFASDATNLVSGDSNGERDIFLGQVFLPADMADSSVSFKGTAEPGETITYTFTLNNAGYESVTGLLISQAPTQTTYVANSATNGAVFDEAEMRLEWQGPVDGSSDVEISFAVVVDPSLTEPTALFSQSTVAGDGNEYHLPAITVINGHQLRLIQVSQN